MTSRERYYKPLLALVMVLGLVLSGFMQQRLDKARADLGLTRLTPLENAPPMLAFTTVALGGFRGLIANALWVRAVEMQDEGKYFEMVQLADWITKLQPHIASVWIAQAWNMSYNISIKFQNPNDRWLWVQRGITLLRDQALKYNPDDSLLYRELAWHFQHKIGANMDDAHMYYKKVWASEMTKAIGGGRPDFEALLKPVTPADQERVKLLKERYKMDPLAMKQADEAYGPLDWRMPETQAIYWAWVGLAKSKNEELIKLRRVIYQSMQMAFQRGQLLESRSGKFAFGPNLDIIPKANKAYEDMMIQDPAQITQIKTGHRNFLRDAVYFLYSYNRLSEAQKWYKYLGEKYPDNPVLNDPASLPAKVSMETYALDRVTEDVGETSMDRVTGILKGIMYQYYQSLAYGFDPERAVNLYDLARKIHARYMKKVDTQAKRVGLESLDLLRNDVLLHLLSTNSPFDPQLQDQLRTELRLPAGATNVPALSPTNAVPATTNAPAR